MEKTKKIEELMGKAKISKEEAEEALEKSNWDLLEAILYLERKDKKEDEKEKKTGRIRKVVGRIFKFLGKIIKKGNENYFEINKTNEKPIRISLTLLVILLMLAFWPVVVLLVIGLFVGYKYSIEGPNLKVSAVNGIFEKASDSAENIKSNFKEGYENN